MKRSIFICFLLVVATSIMMLAADEENSLVGTWRRVKGEKTQFEILVVENEVWSEQEGAFILQGTIKSKPETFCRGGVCTEGQTLYSGEISDALRTKLGDDGGDIEFYWYSNQANEDFGLVGTFNKDQDEIEGTLYKWVGSWEAIDVWKFEQIKPSKFYGADLPAGASVKRVSGGMDIRVKNLSDKTWDYVHIFLERIHGSGHADKDATNFAPNEVVIFPYDSRICKGNGRDTFKATIKAYEQIDSIRTLMGTTEKKVDLNSICKELLAKKQEAQKAQPQEQVKKTDTQPEEKPSEEREEGEGEPSITYGDNLPASVWGERVGEDVKIHIKNTSERTWGHVFVDLSWRDGSDDTTITRVSPNEVFTLVYGNEACEGLPITVSLTAYKDVASNQDQIGTAEKKMELSSVCEVNGQTEPSENLSFEEGVRKKPLLTIGVTIILLVTAVVIKAIMG